MGTLEHLKSAKRTSLSTHTVIGRGAGSTLRVFESYTSGAHASIRWTENGWILQDLNSRNGTFLNGQPVARVGERIEQGMLLGFGSKEDPWSVLDVHPPEIMLVPLDGAAPIDLSEGLTVLPSPEHAEASLFRGRDGLWQVEHDGSTTQLNDQDVVVIGPCAYRFCFPHTVVSTTKVEQSRTLSDGDVRVRLVVSRDEELVSVVALSQNEEVSLGTRACYYLLLTLARLRESSRNEPAGWVSMDELMQLLHVDETQINTDVFRIRQQFSRAGFRDAACVIERRWPRLLRVAVDNLEIVPNQAAPRLD